MPTLSYITNDAAKRLTKQGKITIHFPHDFIQGIMAGWHEFLREPEQYKQQWTFAPATNGSKEDGYFLRDGTPRGKSAVRDDFKEILHFREHLPLLLRQRGVSSSTSYHEWLANMEELRVQCARTAHAIAVGLDRLHGFNFAEQLRQAEDISFIRLISYDLFRSRNAGRTIIGKGHTDGGYLTLHIWDEYPGLFIGMGQDRMLYRGMPNTALAFCGDQAERATAEVCKTLYHQVSDECTLMPQDAATRDAIIYFADLF